MELNWIIQELLEERSRIDHIIQSLEAVERRDRAGRSHGRRGGKSMDGPAREEVSERMKRYWAKRRADRAGATEQSGTAAEDRASAGGAAHDGGGHAMYFAPERAMTAGAA